MFRKSILQLCGVLVLASQLAAAPPSISNISLRGLQIGGTTTVTVDGTNLAPEPRIVLPIPIAGQRVKPGAQSNRVQIEVTLDKSVHPGIYNLRLTNSKGISQAIRVGVDQLPQKPFATDVKQLPTALHGNLTGSQILQTKFTAKSGQRIVVDLEGRRLGSKLKSVLRLYNARGTQVAWSGPKNSISGDPRIEVVCPTDGQYLVELHDPLYRGAAPGFFRLKIGDLQFADIAFPLGVTAGKETSLQFVSASVTSGSIASSSASHQLAKVAASNNFTGARPSVVVSQHREVVESGNLTEVSEAPVAMNGRIAKSGEEDQFLLAVKPGSKLRFDVVARRVGSPLDGILTLRGEKGNQLARNDDRPGMSDPGLDYTVPKNINKIVVAVADHQKRGGPDFVYRVSVRDLGQPDFALTVNTERLNVPIGGTQVLEVQAKRAGYNGPIKLSVDGLPAGFQVAGETIVAGSTVGLLTLTASDVSAVGSVKVIGTSDNMIQRIALPTKPATNEFWQAADIGLATAEPSPITVAWGKGDGERLLNGGTSSFPVMITRQSSAKGPVRLRLLTTQVPPQKKIKKNNKEQTVNDVERTLRIENAELGPNVSTATVHIVTPIDLPQRQWGLVLRAELLSVDKKRVLTSIASPARTFATIQPLQLELAGAKKIEAKAGDGDTGKLKGKLVRTSGFAHPAKLTLIGLPKGYPSPAIEIAADQTEFEFPIRFPYGKKPVELKNIKVRASVQTDPQNARSVVRSNDAAITIKVVAGQKPAG